jgi:hypothetical protein
MTFKAASIAAVLLLGTLGIASAQTVTPAANTAPGLNRVAAAVDVTRLPIDMRRIERRFRQTEFREERDGLNLRYFVDVYAKAPDIVLFTPQDNLYYGPVPYGAPTHMEMLQMMTPQEFRGSTLMLGSRLAVPRKKTDRK